MAKIQNALESFLRSYRAIVARNGGGRGERKWRVLASFLTFILTSLHLIPDSLYFRSGLSGQTPLTAIQLSTTIDPILKKEANMIYIYAILSSIIGSILNRRLSR